MALRGSGQVRYIKDSHVKTITEYQRKSGCVQKSQGESYHIPHLKSGLFYLRLELASRERMGDKEECYIQDVKFCEEEDIQRM